MARQSPHSESKVNDDFTVFAIGDFASLLRYLKARGYQSQMDELLDRYHIGDHFAVLIEREFHNG